MGLFIDKPKQGRLVSSRLVSYYCLFPIIACFLLLLVSYYCLFPIIACFLLLLVSYYCLFPIIACFLLLLVAAPAGRAVDLVHASRWIKRRNAPPKPLVFQCRLLAMTP